MKYIFVGESLKHWRRNLSILWLGVLLTSAGYTMVIPFLPLYLLDLGADEQSVKLWSGVIFSITFLIAALLAPYWGARADKYGKRKMIIRAGLSLAVTYLLGSLVRSPWELFVVRALQGFANGFVPACMAIVASSVPENKMGWSLGIMQTGMATGGILGPLIGGVCSHFLGMRMSFVASAVGIFIATVLVWMFVQEPKSPLEKRSSSVLDDLKIAAGNRPVLNMLAMLLVVQLATMVLQPLITLYVAQLQGNFEEVVLLSGIVFSLAGISGIIAAPTWGKIGQVQGFHKILYIALLGAGILNLFQLMVTNVWQFSVVQFLFGLFLAGVYPAINSIVVQNTDAVFRGRAFGLTTSANQLGCMIGPLIGGVVSSWLSIRSIFVSTGVLLVLASFTVWKSMRSEIADN